MRRRSLRVSSGSDALQRRLRRHDRGSDALRFVYDDLRSGQRMQREHLRIRLSGGYGFVQRHLRQSRHEQCELRRVRRGMHERTGLYSVGLRLPGRTDSLRRRLQGWHCGSPELRRLWNRVRGGNRLRRGHMRGKLRSGPIALQRSVRQHGVGQSQLRRVRDDL